MMRESSFCAFFTLRSRIGMTVAPKERENRNADLTLRHALDQHVSRRPIECVERCVSPSHVEMVTGG
jgi:isocitrate dehydrogenase